MRFIVKAEKIDRKYDNGLINLLCYFLEDSYFDSIENDDRKTIQRYVATFDSLTIERTVLDCLELLSLDDFPDKWLISIMGTKYESTKEWKDWFNMVLKMLHEEMYH